MYSWGKSDLITIVPEVIKLEILKKELIKTYEYEKENKEGFRGEAHWFLKLLQSANLSNEGLTEFYKFAKIARKDLGLPDNLFNIVSSIIIHPEDYEEINEKINKRNIL